ncbi:fimbrillin family protein [Bacteroides sp. 519]|uniref:fimbrillin family protein n=1 Tax=Bacteroides sp. 519 TaxID=2302937 RepID=UPI0013D093D7|nr:fimbrillin family protein [Bacteroides sp. 519]
MKLTKVACFLSLFTTVACVNGIHSSDEPDDDLYPVMLSTQIKQSPSRIVSNSFTNSDAIGIFMLNQPNKLNEERHADNIKFTFSQEYGFQPNKTIFFSDQKVLTDFIGYYPYKDNAVKEGTSIIEVNANTNQTTPESYGQSDFLVANTKNVEASNDPVDIVFEHKMSRLDLQIKPNNDYTIDQLRTLDPTIRIKDVYTNASYNFLDDSFGNQSAPADQIPNGGWEIVNGVLVGKSVLMVPQEIAANHALVEIEINGRTFSYLQTESLLLESGIPREMTFVLESNNNEVKCVLNTQINDWGETKKQESTATEVSTFIDVNDLNFADTKIYKVLNKGTQVAEITLEYLLSNEIETVATIVYPMLNGKVDLQNGIVLKDHTEADKKHGGSISWNVLQNTFTYAPGSSNPIQIIYISENNEIVTSRPENALQVQLKPDVLVDTRGNETFTYPLVKIGTQYWMRTNLKATKYTDGEDIVKGTSFADNTAKYCTHQNAYFFYNSAAIATGKIAPEGWRVSTSTDWASLKTYIKGKTSVLKKDGSWKTSSGIKISNMTGFSAVATGFFKDKIQNINEHASYWSTKDGLADAPIVISYNNDNINLGTNSDVAGYTIRCLKNE